MILKKNKKHYYNNGIICVFREECPNGFSLGHLPLSEEHKKNISKSNKGKIFTKEHKKKLSKSKIGNKYHLNKPHSEETKNRLKELKIGKHLSKEQKEILHNKGWHIGINNSMYGKYHSESTKQKISIKTKGRKGISKEQGNKWYGDNRTIESEIIRKQKEYETKRKNNSFNSSNQEDLIYNKLNNKYLNVYRQYKSNLYPFACDFYVSELDLYIECNFHWTHGFEPYNENNEKHKKIIEKWKLKNTKFYNIAIKVWTISDPKKRKTAKENNLNYLEFFSVEEFYKWYDEMEE